MKRVTWNEFVSEYSRKNGVSRKVAMHEAKRGWAKYKERLPRSKIKGLEKRADVIDFPQPQRRKEPGKMRKIAQTEVLRRSDLGGNLILPDFEKRMRKKHRGRKRKSRTILHDSAYKYMRAQGDVKF